MVDRPHLPVEPELADRVGRGDELLDRGLHQGEVEPPLRLGLAAVPVEELGEDPAGLLLLRALGHVRGHVLRERLDPPAGLLELRRPVFGRRSVLGCGLPSSIPKAASASFRRPSSQVRILQVETQSSRLYAARLSRITLILGLHPLLVLDEGEAGAGLRALPLRHVELLDLLERVRLLRDPHALADDRKRSTKTRAAGGRRARPRGCRSGPSSAEGAVISYCGVVVDVHVRVRLEPAVHVVDEPLEGRLLLLAARRPQRLEGGRRRSLDAPEGTRGCRPRPRTGCPRSRRRGRPARGRGAARSPEGSSGLQDTRSGPCRSTRTSPAAEQPGRGAAGTWPPPSRPAALPGREPRRARQACRHRSATRRSRSGCG